MEKGDLKIKKTPPFGRVFERYCYERKRFIRNELEKYEKVNGFGLTGSFSYKGRINYN
jgi:hypothetical protein